MRDLRDPQVVGTTLLSDIDAVRKVYGKDIPAHEVWDNHTGKYVKGDVSKNDSMQMTATLAYLAELEAGAAEGDRYSKAALDRLHSPLPVDSPYHP